MIQPIVEGDGEVAAFPVLLRRLLAELGVYLEIGPAIKQNRSDLVRELAFKNALKLASFRPHVEAVIVLFDSDEDCARALIPQMAQWAAEDMAHLPCAIVLARREYESWFLAAIESLRGIRGIREDAAYADDPEVKGDAKGAIRRMTPKNAPYSPTADQPALSAVFDLAQAYRNARSFRKLVKELCRVLAESGYQARIPPQWEASNL